MKEGESDHYGSWNSIIREKDLAVSIQGYVCGSVVFLFLRGI